MNLSLRYGAVFRGSKRIWQLSTVNDIGRTKSTDGLLFTPNTGGRLWGESFCTFSATSRQSRAVVGLMRGLGIFQHRQGYEVKFVGRRIAESMEGSGERGVPVVAERKWQRYARKLMICMFHGIFP